MFKLFILACFLAVVAASPKPGLLAPVAYTAAYPAPVAAAYTAYPAYSAAYAAPVAAAYSAPVAYSPYAYASPYSAYYLRR